MEDPENSAIELWKELAPDVAYMSGSDDRGGTLFIPSRDNVSRKRREIDLIWRSTLDVSMRSLLRWARCDLDLQEPQRAPQEILTAIIDHLVKAGPRNPLLPPLLETGSRYMEHAINNLKIRRWPLEMHLVSVNRTGALKDFLMGLPDTDRVTGPADELLEKVIEYGELFPIKDEAGVGHEELVSILEGADGHLGRRDIFPRIFSEMYASPDRPNSAEEKLLLELYDEIAEMKKITLALGDQYGVPPDTEELITAVRKERRIRENDVIGSFTRMRDKIVYWAVRRIIDFPHELDINILETPPFMESSIPSVISFNMNGLSGRPRTDLFIRTGKGKAPTPSLPELFLLEVNEELGKRALYLNSFLRPLDNVKRPDLLPLPAMTATSMGYSQYRELEVLGLLKDMSDRRHELYPDEKRLWDHIEEHCSLDELIGDLGFIVSRKRVLNLLQAIADIRINTGRQSLVEFMRWAHIVTGIREKKILDSTLGPAVIPGLHAAQQLISMDLREISQVVRNQGMNLKEFNTRSTSLGFPSWRFLRSALLEL